MAKWTNSDGLTVRMGGENPVTYNVGEPRNSGDIVKSMFIDFDYVNYPNYDKDANNDGTKDSFTGHTPEIPAGSTIHRAYIQVKAAITGGTATGIDIGLYNKAGTAIDADGLATAAGAGALAGLTANTTVVCSGALASNDNIGTADAYVKFTPNGTLAAGTGRLVIEYVPGRA